MRFLCELSPRATMYELNWPANSLLGGELALAVDGGRMGGRVLAVRGLAGAVEDVVRGEVDEPGGGAPRRRHHEYFLAL